MKEKSLPEGERCFSMEWSTSSRPMALNEKRFVAASINSVEFKKKKKGMRLLWAQDQLKFERVTSVSAAQGLWFRNNEVRSQVVGLDQWFLTGGPQLGIIMHKWATDLVYFENGFACRIKLKNTGAYEQSYGFVPVNWRGHPENWRGNDFFLGDQLYCHVILCLSQCYRNYFIKVGCKNLWTLEVGHGTKKVEKHWSRQDAAPLREEQLGKLGEEENPVTEQRREYTDSGSEFGDREASVSSAMPQPWLWR